MSQPRLAAYRSHSGEIAFLQFVRLGVVDILPFYYALFRVHVPTAGLYTFRSKSSSDSYGCLYIDQFDASDPELNLIAFNDDYGRDLNFRLSADLIVGTSYYLVLTWFKSYTSDGSAMVYVSGPADANIHLVNGMKFFLEIISHIWVIDETLSHHRSSSDQWRVAMRLGVDQFVLSSLFPKTTSLMRMSEVPLYL